MNAEFNLIKKQLWTIIFVSNLQLEFIFGSYGLVGAKSLALYSGASGQPCCTRICRDLSIIVVANNRESRSYELVMSEQE